MSPFSEYNAYGKNKNDDDILESDILSFPRIDVIANGNEPIFSCQ